MRVKEIMMQVNSVGYQPSFQAKFIKSQAMMNYTKAQINNGKEEELEKYLDSLSKHHKNIALHMTDNKTHMTITNLYNNRSIVIHPSKAEQLDELNDIKSRRYNELFVGEKVITPAKTNKIANILADKYFVKSAPDYTIGHIVDSSF